MLIPILVAASAAWIWPLPPTVLSSYTPPRQTWAAGHRGIDLAAVPGQSVRAVAAGTVRFVGLVGGIPTLSIDHGRLRSTYQPVHATVVIGEQVAAGQPVGSVTGQLPHCSNSCLHLGAKIPGGYVDPLDLLAASPVVLKPAGGPG